MPKSYKRTDRVADRLHRELAKLINVEFRDKSVGFITISNVILTKDFSLATVYITILEDSQKDIALQTLNDAAIFLRTKIANNINLRTTPKLKFVYDATLVKSQRMDSLIDNLQITPLSDDE